jgi:hypothetical protein
LGTVKSMRDLRFDFLSGFLFCAHFELQASAKLPLL